MAEVLDWFKQSEDVPEKFLVHRCLCPLGPVADVIRVGAACNCCGEFRVGHAKLDGLLRNIDAAFLAKCGGLFAGDSYFLRFLVPLGEWGVSEQACAKRAGIHDSDTLFL